jgi:integrase
VRKPPHIKKTSAGWQIDYRVGGRRYRRLFERRMDAERASAQVFAAYGATLLGMFQSPPEPASSAESVLLKDAAERHLALVKPERTVETQRADQERFNQVILPRFGHRPIHEITTADVLEFRNDRVKTVSPATTNRELSTLSCVFRSAITLGLVAENPVLKVKRLHEVSAEAKPFSPEEVKLLLEHARPPLREFIVVAAFTGMRPGELRHLRWVDVDFEGKFIEVASRKDFVTKTKRSRRIPMNADSEKALRAVHAFQARKRLRKQGEWTTELVFPNLVTGMAARDFRTSWETTCRAAGLWPRRVYDLRHTFGCWAAMKGEDLFTLQRWMGHASITTTQRYAKHRPQEFRGKLDDLTLGERPPTWAAGGR